MSQSHATETAPMAPIPAAPAAPSLAPGPLVLADALTPAVVVSISATAGNVAAGRAISRHVLARTPLFSALPETERRRLTEITDQPASLPLATIHSPDGSTRHTLATSAQFATEIPAALHDVLTSVASALRLAANTTRACALDLTPYGGGPGVYRFTRTATAVLIDVVEATATPAPAAAASAAERIERYAMTLSGLDADMDAAVRQAIERLPAGSLEALRGIRFARGRREPHLGPGPDPREAGHYIIERHLIELFPGAETPTVARFGDAGGAGSANRLVWIVLHEIGHAIDMAPLRRAMTAEQAANAALTSFLEPIPADDEGARQFSSRAQEREFHRLDDAASDASTAVDAARGLSGIRLEDGPDDLEAASGFREALEADGSGSLTPYPPTQAGHEISENFAEAFTMFITEPRTLEGLRPHVFRFFTRLTAARARKKAAAARSL